MPRTSQRARPAPLALDAPLDEARALFDRMRASPPPAPQRSPTLRRQVKRSLADAADQYHLTDEASGRKYRVEYLRGSTGKLARVRGRVALDLADLPPHLRSLPKLKDDGTFAHVYERALKLKELADDHRTAWYQPMFKKRWTHVDENGVKTRGVTWYASLGSYWNADVAAVAAELALQRYASSGTREEIERVERDLVQMAREHARR